MLLKFGIDVDATDSESKIKALEDIVRLFGEELNKNFKLNIDTNNLDEVIKKINTVKLGIDELGKVSTINLGFSSDNSSLSFSTQEFQRLADIYSNMNAGNLLDTNIKYRTTISDKDVNNEKEYLQYLKEEQKIVEYLDKMESSVSDSYADYKAKQEKEYLQYLKEEQKITEALDAKEYSLGKEYEIKQQKEYLQYLKEEQKIVESLDNKEYSLGAEWDKSQVKNINSLISKYEKLNTEKEKVSSTILGDDSSSLKLTNQLLDETVSKIKEYGISVEDVNGAVQLSFDNSKIGIDENSNAYNNLIQVIEKYNQQSLQSKSNKEDSKEIQEINEYIKLLEKLTNLTIDLKREENKGNTSSSYYEELTRQINETKSKMETYSDSVKENTEVKKKNQSESERLVTAQKKIESGVDDATRSVNKFTEALKDSTRGFISVVLPIGSFHDLSDVIENTLNKLVELDKAMTNIQMVTGQTDEQVRETISSYANMAKELGVTTQTVADGSLEWLNSRSL